MSPLPSSSYKDIPGHPLRCNYEGNLKELLVYTKPKCAKKIFYQQLSMNIDELESKKQFKCLWLSINMKEEKELILFPNKNGTVKTLLEEAAKQIDFNFEEGSGQLRIVEVSNAKLLLGPLEDDPLECELLCGCYSCAFHNSHFPHILAVQFCKRRRKRPSPIRRCIASRRCHATRSR